MSFSKDISKKIFNEFCDDYNCFISNTDRTIYEYKKKILNFVKENFDEYDIERLKVLNCSNHICNLGCETSHYPFINIHDFLIHNKKIIMKLNNNDVYFIINLIDRIKKKKINVMDKEYMIDRNATGFYWDKHGNLIIFNER